MEDTVADSPFAVSIGLTARDLGTPCSMNGPGFGVTGIGWHAEGSG